MVFAIDLCWWQRLVTGDIRCQKHDDQNENTKIHLLSESILLSINDSFTETEELPPSQGTAYSKHLLKFVYRYVLFTAHWMKRRHHHPLDKPSLHSIAFRTRLWEESHTILITSPAIKTMVKTCYQYPGSMLFVCFSESQQIKRQSVHRQRRIVGLRCSYWGDFGSY